MEKDKIRKTEKSEISVSGMRRREFLTKSAMLEAAVGISGVGPAKTTSTGTAKNNGVSAKVKTDFQLIELNSTMAKSQSCI